MIHVEHTTNDGRVVSVDVFEAEVRHNLRRAALIRKAVNEVSHSEEFDALADIIKTNTYPACVAASTNYQDSKYPDRAVDVMTFEEFIEIPDIFSAKWAEAVFRLNPGWSAMKLVPQMTPSGKPKRSKSS